MIQLNNLCIIILFFKKKYIIKIQYFYKKKKNNFSKDEGAANTIYQAENGHDNCYAALSENIQKYQTNPD